MSVGLWCRDVPCCLEGIGVGGGEEEECMSPLATSKASGVESSGKSSKGLGFVGWEEGPPDMESPGSGLAGPACPTEGRTEDVYLARDRPLLGLLLFCSAGDGDPCQGLCSAGETQCREESRTDDGAL